MLFNWKPGAAAVLACSLACPIGVFADDASAPAYVCHRVPDGAIRIDGRIDELCWAKAEWMEFRDLVDGAQPKIPSHAKILWDSNCLYAAYEIKDPNVVAYYGDWIRGAAPNMGEPEIMHRDTFVKFFLDPDADGVNYIEIHVNAINNVADLLLDYPYLYKRNPESGGLQSRQALGLSLDIESKPDWHWNCEGLQSAALVHGTLNHPQDLDDGWTVELAVPWEALKPLSKGPYSPLAGENKWRAHLGHVYKPEFDIEKRRKSKHFYGTWPVLGKLNCHLPELWGCLAFQND